MDHIKHLSLLIWPHQIYKIKKEKKLLRSSPINISSDLVCLYLFQFKHFIVQVNGNYMTLLLFDLIYI